MGMGPPPKPANTRQRRNADPVAPKTLAADGERRGPDLPDDVAWHSMTRAWWETWRLSAQAQTFTPTDWASMLETALIHTEFWSGDLSLAAELRLRAGKMGATPEDRLRLRQEILPPESEQPQAAPRSSGKVTEIASRRKRVSES
jgi:hypothetical protein